MFSRNWTITVLTLTLTACVLQSPNHETKSIHDLVSAKRNMKNISIEAYVLKNDPLGYIVTDHPGEILHGYPENEFASFWDNSGLSYPELEACSTKKVHFTGDFDVTEDVFLISAPRNLICIKTSPSPP